MHLDAELLRTRLLEWDFDSETNEIDEIRRNISAKVPMYCLRLTAYYLRLTAYH